MSEKTDIFLKVNKEDIAFITTIIESFEGVAAVRTPNPDPKSKTAILQCIVSPDCLNQMDLIIKDLSKDHYIKRISPGETA